VTPEQKAIFPQISLASVTLCVCKAMTDIKDLHGNMRALISRPKSIESDKEEFSRFHPEKVWKLDSDVHACASCRVSFGMTRRKHHCRECGDLFCSDCSGRQIVVHGTLKRCCDDCYAQAVYDSSRPAYPAMDTRGGDFDRFADGNGGSGSGSSALRPHAKVGSLNAWASSNSFERASFMANSISGSPGRGSRKENKGGAEEAQAQVKKGGKAKTQAAAEGAKRDAGSAFQYPPWVEALVYVRDESFTDGGVTSSKRAVECHPAGSLPAHMLQDIAETSVLCNSGNAPRAGDDISEANFMFRTRDRSMGGLLAVGAGSQDADGEDVSAPSEPGAFNRADVTSGTLFYNCFVSYREGSHEVNNGYSSSQTAVRHAVVVVSRWPFPLVAFYALHKLDEALSWSSMGVGVGAGAEKSDSPGGSLPVTLSSSSSNTDLQHTKKSLAQQAARVVAADGALHADFQVLILNVLIIGYKELLAFPEPQPGQTMSCPFLGETLQYHLPVDVRPAYGHNLSLAAAANSVNLVAKLAPLGLLNHIWELWELVATGKDILVMGSTAAQSSELVLALASLLSPLGYNGDCRPFMQPKDKDVLVLKKLSLTKQQERKDQEAKAREGNAFAASTARTIRNSSILVGATDPKMLHMLQHFEAVIFLAPVGSNELPQTTQAMCEQVRQRNAATFHLLGDDESFSSLFVEWEKSISARADGKSSASREQSTMVLYRTALQTTLDRDVVRAIQNMDSLTSMRVLGDKLMRDRLSAMTVAFFKPVDAGITLEVAEMRSAAQERARIAVEQQQMDRLKEAIQQDCSSGLVDVGAISSFMRGLPAALPWMVPTIILWVLYVTGLSFYLLTKQPLPPLLCLVLIGVFPEQAPKKFERLLRVFIPLWMLYPLVFDMQGRRKDGRDGRKRRGDDSWERIPSNTPITEDMRDKGHRKSVTINEDGNDDIRDDGEKGNGATETAAATGPPSADVIKMYSGVWKRYKTVDYDKFIMAQGGSWMKGRLAASISLEHVITVDESGKFYRLMEKGGPVKTDHTYTVDGVTVDETVISEARFKDTCSWENGAIFIHKLAQPKEDYELRVHRYVDDSTHMRVVASYINFAKPEKNIIATSFFEKTGPSPFETEMEAKMAALAAAGGAPAAPSEDLSVADAGAASDSPISTEKDSNSNVARGRANTPPTPASGGSVPVAVAVAVEGTRSTSLKTTSENTVDFGGTWLRNRNANYDAILFALGLTHTQRRSALANRMVLTIKMSENMQRLTVTETATAERANGGSDTGDTRDPIAKDNCTETTYDINVQGSGKLLTAEIELLGHRYLETATFHPSARGGGTLRIQQTRRDNFCENVIELSLMPSMEGGETELCMCSIYRNLKYKDKPQVEAVQVFKRLSDEDNEAYRKRNSSALQAGAGSTAQPQAQPASAVEEEAEEDWALLESRRKIHGAWQTSTNANSAKSTSAVSTCKLSLSRGMASVTISEKTDTGAYSHFYDIGSSDDATAPRSTVQGLTYVEKATWAGDCLLVTKRAVQGNCTITQRRRVAQTAASGWRGATEELLLHTVVTQDGRSSETEVAFSRVP